MGLFDSVKDLGGSIGDTLFGSSPKLQVKQKSLLNPAQNELLNSLLGIANSRVAGGTYNPAGDALTSFLTTEAGGKATKKADKAGMTLEEFLAANASSKLGKKASAAGVTPQSFAVQPTGGEGTPSTGVNFNADTIPPGSLETQPIPLENLSLSALEERAKQIAGGGNPLEQATTQQLLDIISSGGTPSGGQTFEDFFRTNVEDPLTKAFNERTQEIGTRFKGNALFSSDRQQADATAKDDFLHSLSTSRGELAFNERQSSQQNLLAALGLAGQNQGKTSDELTKILQSAFGERQFAGDNADARLQEFLTNQGLKQQQLQNLLSLLGISSFENIGAATGGSSGLLPSLIGAGGNVLSANILSRKGGTASGTSKT
jgi:hypothetical protein